MTTPGERAAELITQASKEFYIQAAQTANTVRCFTSFTS